MNAQLNSIQILKGEWDALQPLAPERDCLFWQKLRLEWNYHSNHIEGNTLTYGETELLLIHGATHGNHTLREYEEMQAHDVGIVHVRELAEDHTRLIGEAEIRNLNKIILKEPFWKPAQTPEGQPTRKQIIPGEYKTTPNNVKTATGALFEFAAPTDVPLRMQALRHWLEQALSQENPPILPLIAKLHHDFVLIHPFDDGNGRVARMLVNYVLIRQGFPPIIVPTERKNDYLNALRLADAGDLLELENFLGTCLVRSLELGIKAAKGESLEEVGDVEKEIALLVRKQEHHTEKVRPRSREAIYQLYESGLKPFLSTLIEKMRGFKPLFVDYKIALPDRHGNEPTILDCFETKLASGFEKSNSFEIQFQLKGYRGEADRPFNINRVVVLNFADFDYTVTVDNKVKARKLYSEPLLHEESANVIEDVLRSTLDLIKAQSRHA